VKRLIDIIISCVLLVIASPLIVVASDAIWIQDGRSPLFLHDRIGRGGRVFKLIKFRTMSHGPWSIEDRPIYSDVRVTWVGRVLRRTAMDDVLNLVNVLKGDISLVGPRPMPPAINGIDIRTIQGWEERNRVVPGMIGLAQLYCPKHCLPRQKFRYDSLYVHRQLPMHCLCTDLWLTGRAIRWVFDKGVRP